MKHSQTPLPYARDASPPHGGVWIETPMRFTIYAAILSPPHGGVWIETRMPQVDRVMWRHPLTGGCGLKLVNLLDLLRDLRHPLTGGCGLKLV